MGFSVLDEGAGTIEYAVQIVTFLGITTIVEHTREEQGKDRTEGRGRATDRCNAGD